MNLVEHYIEKVISIEDVTNKMSKIIKDLDEPMYEIKMIVDCYGRVTTEEVIWRKSEYEKNMEIGYYLA